MPGADAWLLVEPELPLPLPQAATNTVAMPTHATVSHRLELGSSAFITPPPLSVDSNVVSGTTGERRQTGMSRCLEDRAVGPASRTPAPHRTPPAAGCW